MSQKNYTSIDDLVKQSKTHTVPSSYNSGGKHKESEPILRPAEKYEVKEAIEYEPEEEVKPFVQPRAETITLPPDIKKLGVQASTTTQFPTFQNVKTLISDDKIVSGLHQPVTSSIRWLATLALYILQQAHLTIKVVHGKILRVVKN